ncbi:MAG: hypothetical protein EXQ71_12170 [Acidimicrobiia bacterium]|nr:hypothetical protein [Acidimicrobiia bacterium]
MPRPRVLVVGAGVAGLTAARNLSDSYDVVVLDKGRGVGGRLATRRIGDATFDHGAQFITTHTPEFAEVVAGWERAGVARPWFQGRIGPGGIVDPDGHTRFRGVATMNAIAKHLAEGLDVRVSSRVVALDPSDAGWRIRLDDAAELAAAVVVLTASAIANPHERAVLHRRDPSPAAAHRRGQRSVHPAGRRTARRPSVRVVSATDQRR